MDRLGSIDTNRTQSFLRVENASTVGFDGPGGFAIGAARLQSAVGGVGMTDPHLNEDAFMINVQMIDYEGEIFLNNQKLAFRRQPAGQTAFFDYRKNWRANLRSPFGCLNFHVDRRALGIALTNERPVEVDTLVAAPGEPVADQQLFGLALAMWPVFNLPNEPNRLFMEHLGWALCLHLADRYGMKGSSSRRARGGLAAWQERRAKELIEASLNGDISVEVLAIECGLSVAHFSRSFRKSVGMPPHQWLLTRRVEKAKQLLMDEVLPLSHIAVGCGFADQSHLSRVFRKFTGIPPLAWRKLNLQSRRGKPASATNRDEGATLEL